MAAAAPAPWTTDPAAVEKYLSELPSGYRFRPTDGELVVDYLRNKIHNLTLPPNRIRTFNIYNSNPLQLYQMYGATTRESACYFFTTRKKKYPNGTKTARNAGGGYWKSTTGDMAVVVGDTTVGGKRTLVYHQGTAAKSVKTDWLMQEYRLNPKHLPTSVTNGEMDEYVLVKVYHKNMMKNNNNSFTISPQDDEAAAADQQVEKLSIIPYPQHHHPHQDNNNEGINLLIHQQEETPILLLNSADDHHQHHPHHDDDSGNKDGMNHQDDKSSSPSRQCNEEVKLLIQQEEKIKPTLPNTSPTHHHHHEHDAANDDHHHHHQQQQQEEKPLLLNTNGSDDHEAPAQDHHPANPNMGLSDFTHGKENLKEERPVELVPFPPSLFMCEDYYSYPLEGVWDIWSQSYYQDLMFAEQAGEATTYDAHYYHEFDNKKRQKLN